MVDHNKEQAEKIVRASFDGWFGESLEDMEDEARVRKDFFDPLVKAITFALGQKFDQGVAVAAPSGQPWQLVSTNVPGNIHTATEWINGTGLALYLMHIEFTGGASIAVFKVPAAVAPKVREAMGQIPESWPNKPIFKEWRGVAP